MATMLVVEDDAAIGELLTQILVLEGHEVLVARTSCQALSILLENRIDLIIADLEPGLYRDASWMGVRQLRQAAAYTSIIVCTGHKQASLVPLEQYSINAVLAKPFDLDQLIDLVAKYC
jgi:DNA-binding response OmpR family regulator